MKHWKSLTDYQMAKYNKYIKINQFTNEMMIVLIMKFQFVC